MKSQKKKTKKSAPKPNKALKELMKKELDFGLEKLCLVETQMDAMEYILDGIGIKYTVGSGNGITPFIKIEFDDNGNNW